MRIATSTIYENQSSQIDNLTAMYQQQGAELSSGISLNVPSDNPTVIAQDLSVRTDIGIATQLNKNFSDLQNELTTTDGALSNLTNVLQSARALAIQGASGTIGSAEENQIAQQVDQLLQETVGIANTQYAGKYVFAGTASPSQPLVQTTGNPITGVISAGNNVQQVQQLPNGQTVPTEVTMQQAFNYQAHDGSPDAFQALMNLRNTLQSGAIVDYSQSQVNVGGQAITQGAGATQLSALLTGAAPKILSTPLQPDGGTAPAVASISIASSGAPNGVTITFNSTDTMANVIASINAQTATTGVTASFNYQTQRLSLSSTAAFAVTDVPSPGAPVASNFTKAFNLTNQADLTNTLTTQLGDIDHILQATLGARGQLGSTIQAVQALSSSTSLQITNDTKVQSGLEDTDIAKVTTQFTQTQTVLQAAYATTSRLEAKDLFDYI